MTIPCDIGFRYSHDFTLKFGILSLWRVSVLNLLNKCRWTSILGIKVFLSEAIKVIYKQIVRSLSIRSTFRIIIKFSHFSLYLGFSSLYSTGALLTIKLLLQYTSPSEFTALHVILPSSSIRRSFKVSLKVSASWVIWNRLCVSYTKSNNAKLHMY